MKAVVPAINQSQILPSDSKFNTRLNEQQCFLLIGCLGGLGRSVARYMSCVGARAFVFLGRSGADKPAAQEMIRDIQSAGARVKVIAGDVTSREDICKALDAVSQLGPLGGVVQGAMSLNVRIPAFVVVFSESKSIS